MSKAGSEAVRNAAKLLQCPEAELVKALTHRSMTAGGEHIMRKLSVDAAGDARDALAKAVYAGLFTWLVDQARGARRHTEGGGGGVPDTGGQGCGPACGAGRMGQPGLTQPRGTPPLQINSALRAGSQGTPRAAAATTLSILDIYGFECFK